jgi:hypothetical protein
MGSKCLSYWVVSEKVFKSGFLGPDGGLIPQSKTLSVEDLQDEFSDIERHTRELGLEHLQIRLPPEPLAYSLAANTKEVLQSRKWKLRYFEIDQIVHVDGNWMGKINRNRMRELKEVGEYYKLNDSFTIETVHEILSKNRSQIGAPQNISLEKFKFLNLSLADKVKNFVVSDADENPVAAAFTLRIDPKSVYVSQWGDIREGSNPRRKSPMTFLASVIHEYCSREQVEFLYLGGSSLNGEINLGLARFKESLGAKSYSREIWEKGIK